MLVTVECRRAFDGLGVFTMPREEEDRRRSTGDSRCCWVNRVRRRPGNLLTIGQPHTQTLPPAASP
jgi:hypothetical protein